MLVVNGLLDGLVMGWDSCESGGDVRRRVLGWLTSTSHGWIEHGQFNL